MFLFVFGKGASSNLTDYKFTFKHGKQPFFPGGRLKYALPLPEALRFKSITPSPRSRIVILKLGKSTLISKTVSPPAAASLLTLPPEIRQQTYDLLVINRPEHMNRQHQINIIPAYTSAQHSIQLQPAISQVCRTLRREILPFYYAENTFMISLDGATVRKQGRTVLKQDSYFLKWLRAIGQRRCEEIRAIAVYVHQWDLNPWPKEMALSRDLDLLMQELRWNGVKGVRREVLSEVAAR